MRRRNEQNVVTRASSKILSAMRVVTRSVARASHADFDAPELGGIYMEEQKVVADLAAHRELVAILIGRYERVSRALKESGRQPYQESRVTDFDLTGEIHVLSRFVERRSVLMSDEVRHYYAYEILDLTFPDDDELAAATRIITSLGKSFHQPWYHIPADDDIDPAVVLFQTVIWPLSDYFMSLAPAADKMAKLAKSLAAEILMTLSTGSGSVIERIALDGVVIDRPLTAGRIILRPLEADERAGIAARYDYTHSYAVQLVGPNMEYGVSGTCMLEARTRWNVVEPPPQSLFWVDRAVLALELLGVKVGGPGWVHTSTEPRNVVLDNLRPMRLSPRAPRRVPLNSAFLDQVAQLAELIPEEAVTEPKNRHDVALNRFLRGCAAPTPGDALLEHTIALEAVLLPSKFEGELAYRLRLNAAWLLGVDRSTRIEIARKLSRIYTLRSALVHGLKMPKNDELEEASSWARAILSDLLRHCLEEEWPSDADLAHVALG